MIIDKLKIIKDRILYILPELGINSLESIDGIIKAYYITRAINNKCLDQDAYDIYQSSEIQSIKAHDIYSTISIMKNMARQNSNGAAQLKTVFCSEEDYNLYRSTIKVEGHFVCIILQTVLLSSPFLTKGKLIGFCEPKFSGITFDKLIVEGYIGE